MSLLPIERREGSRPDITIVRPDGPLTIRVLPEFAGYVKPLTPQLLVLDLGGVPHMDSAGLGAVLNLLTVQQKAGRRLVLANPTQRVQMLINLTKVDTVLKTYPTVEAAEQA